MKFSGNSLLLVLDEWGVSLSATRLALENGVHTMRHQRVMKHRVLAIPATVDIDPEIHTILQLGGTGKRRVALHLVALYLDKGVPRDRLKKACNKCAGQ